jgi:HlyD family secretion protein
MTHRHRFRPGLSLGTVLAVLVALAVGGAGGYFFPKPDASATKNKARSTDDGKPRITALGRLQPAGGIVPLFGPPGDQIVELDEKLAPGVTLKKGDVIGKLKSAEMRDREVTVADIQLKEAQTALDAAVKAGNERIAAARAELKQAEDNEKTDVAALEIKARFLKYAAEVAATQVDRVKNLRGTGVRVAEEDIEKAELQLEQAKAERDGAAAMVEKTKATYQSSIAVARAKIAAAEADLAAEKAKAPVKSGAEKLKLARAMADLTTLRAPIDGQVLKVVGRTGQPTGLEPVLQMANLDNLTAVAEVYESDVKALNEWLAGGGVKADVTNPALGDAKLSGTVTSADISQMIARNTVFAMGPREDADRRVVEVVVRLTLNGWSGCR